MSQPSSPVLKALKQQNATNKSLRYLTCISLALFSCWYLLLYSVLSPKVHFGEDYRLLANLVWTDEPHSPSNISSTANLTLSKHDNLSTSKLLGGDDHTSHPPRSSSELASLAVVLPVTSSSLVNMTSTLTGLLSDPGIVSEVLLLSCSVMQTSIRSILHQILSSTDNIANVDFSILPWAHGIDEGTAALHATRQTITSRILFLDSSGFAFVDEHIRRTLLSYSLTAVPVGLQALSLDNGQPLCQLPGEALPAYFFRPPFILPSELIPSYTFTKRSTHGTWAALGQHLSSSRFYRESTTILNGETGCSSEIFEDISQAVRIEIDLESSTMEAKTQAGTFALVFPQLEDLQHLSSVICRLRQSGQSVYALISDDSGIDLVGLGKYTLREPCDIDIAVMPDYNSLDDAGIALSEWMMEMSSFPEVVLTPVQDHALLTALSLVLRPGTIGTTLIRIPPSDLRYCDWLGSLSLEEWRNWHKPQVDVTIITNDRPKSLLRLIRSLTSARFFGDSIHLHVRLEQTADADTLRTVREIEWEHGSMSVHRRVIHGGLLPSVVESWYPHSNDSYALILEDDVEVSPLFYAWVKMSLLKYRYGRDRDKSHNLFGISLYQQKNLELRPEGRHRFSPWSTFAAVSLPHLDTPYLSQIPCSWGAVYFPQHWREFYDYLSVRLSGVHPSLPMDGIVAPGVRSNKWTRSWKKYFIEMAYLRGYVMLYPNYQDYLSLSTNHLEIGSHVKDMPPAVYAQKQKLFLLPLMTLPDVGTPDPISTGLLALPYGKMPSWGALPVLDLFGLPTTEAVLLKRGYLRAEELFRCGVGHIVTSIGSQDHFQDWMCSNLPSWQT